MSKEETKQAAPVEREIKPNKKRPIEININGRPFRGSVIIVTGKEKGKDGKVKDIEQVVESKTRFIPAPLVAVLMSEKNPERLKKIESKLVPLSSTGSK